MVRTYVVSVMFLVCLVQLVFAEQSVSQQRLAQAQGSDPTESRQLYREALAGSLSAIERLDARKGLVIAQLNCRQFSDAHQELTILREQQGTLKGMGSALQEIARTYGAQGKCQEALSIYDEVIANYSDEIDASMWAQEGAAILCLEQGNLEQAKVYKDRLVKNYRHQGETAMALGRLAKAYRKQGRKQEDRELLEASLDIAQKNNDYNIQAWTGQALAFEDLKQGDTESSELRIQRMIKDCHGHDGWVPALSRYAQECRANRKHDHGIWACQQALQSHGDDPYTMRLWKDLALCSMDAGQPELAQDAVKQLRQRWSSRDDYPEQLFLIGHGWDRVNYFDQAVEVFAELSQRDPGHKLRYNKCQAMWASQTKNSEALSNAILSLKDNEDSSEKLKVMYQVAKGLFTLTIDADDYQAIIEEDVIVSTDLEGANPLLATTTWEAGSMPSELSEIYIRYTTNRGKFDPFNLILSWSGQDDETADGETVELVLNRLRNPVEVTVQVDSLHMVGVEYKKQVEIILDPVRTVGFVSLEVDQPSVKIEDSQGDSIYEDLIQIVNCDGIPIDEGDLSWNLSVPEDEEELNSLYIKGVNGSCVVDDVILTAKYSYDDTGDSDAIYDTEKTITVVELILELEEEFNTDHPVNGDEIKGIVNVGDVVPAHIRIYPYNLDSARVILDVPSQQDRSEMIVCYDKELNAPVSPEFVWASGDVIGDSWGQDDPEFYVQINHTQSHTISGTLYIEGEVWDISDITLSPKVYIARSGQGTYLPMGELEQLTTSINPKLSDGTVSIRCYKEDSIGRLVQCDDPGDPKFYTQWLDRDLYASDQEFSDALEDVQYGKNGNISLEGMSLSECPETLYIMYDTSRTADIFTVRIDYWDPSEDIDDSLQGWYDLKLTTVEFNLELDGEDYMWIGDMKPLNLFQSNDVSEGVLTLNITQDGAKLDPAIERLSWLAVCTSADLADERQNLNWDLSQEDFPDTLYVFAKSRSDSWGDIELVLEWTAPDGSSYESEPQYLTILNHDVQRDTCFTDEGGSVDIDFVDLISGTYTIEISAPSGYNENEYLVWYGSIGEEVYLDLSSPVTIDMRQEGLGSLSHINIELVNTSLGRSGLELTVKIFKEGMQIGDNYNIEIPRVEVRNYRVYPQWRSWFIFPEFGTEFDSLYKETNDYHVVYNYQKTINTNVTVDWGDGCHGGSGSSEGWYTGGNSRWWVAHQYDENGVYDVTITISGQEETIQKKYRIVKVGIDISSSTSPIVKVNYNDDNDDQIVDGSQWPVIGEQELVALDIDVQTERENDRIVLGYHYNDIKVLKGDGTTDYQVDRSVGYYKLPLQKNLWAISGSGSAPRL